jgi:drug/metabolite transporter (DMT)-like permease
MLAISFAVLAAAFNAVGAVLQRAVGRDEPDRHAFSIELLVNLLRSPRWVAGVAAIVLGFVAQAAALTLGEIAEVQPLLVAELPFALLLGSVAFRMRPRRGEWVSIAALSCGIAGFVFCLGPHGGDPLGAPLTVWLLALAASALVVGVAVMLGRARRRHRRAALLGIATGILFGVNAALTSAIGAAFRDGPLGVFSTWQTYLLIVLGPAAFYLLQNALQAGSLIASQPGFTLTNPVVSVGWGLAVFDEHVRGGWWAFGSVLSAVLIAVGTVSLARSPLFSGQRREPEPTGRRATG